MICYKDMAFCPKDCDNKKCRYNKQNIDKPKELEWMPVAFTEFKDCKRFKGRSTK